MTINIAIMGFGTIGSGVFDVVNANPDILRDHVGDDVAVSRVLDIREFPGEPVEKVLTNDVNVILNDEQVKIVVETMGGVEPAFTFVKGALEAGKSVVTSNKELVAAKGPELFACAAEHNASFLFGASVGGGIPIIRPLLQCLTADRIERISGILNGTTNYILTKMNAEGVEFEAALKEAQEKGFAERDPTADIEGHDACRKISILSSIVLGKRVDFADVRTEGISAISTKDFEYADAMGREIKLVADSVLNDGAPQVLVAPFLVERTNPLASVTDVFNAVLVHGNMVDDVMFYGRGAGSHATASAVVADVVEAAKNLGTTVYAGWSADTVELADPATASRRFFFRARRDDYEKVLEALKATEIEYADGDEFGFITEEMTEGAFAQATSDIDLLSVIRLL